jgi:hypothetical protein
VRDLVDYQKIAAGYARAAFSRDLVACGNIDDIDGDVGKLRTEGGGQVIAAAFDENHVQRRKPAA